MNFVSAVKPVGKGKGPAQSQHPEKLPLSRNPAKEFPFQKIVLWEPKLKDFHAPRRKGNVENSNRVKENAQRNLTDIPRGCRESPSALGSCNKQQKTWKQQEEEWMGSAKKYSLL